MDANTGAVKPGGRRSIAALGRIRQMLDLPTVSLIIVLLLCATRGMLPQLEQIYSLVIILIILLNWKNREFYLYTAVFMFFVEQFYLVAGSTPAFRVYSYLAVIRFALDIGKMRFRPQFIPVIIIFVTFCLISATRIDARRALSTLVDAVLSYAVVINLRQDGKLLRKFTVVYVCTAICAGLYSLMAKTVVTYDTGIGVQVTIVRYFGTVGDANFAGLFYDLAFFFALCSDGFKRWYLRVPVLAALLYFIILTASQTALLCLGGGLLLYIILRYRMRGLPIVILVAALMAILLLVLINMPELSETNALYTIVSRIQQSANDFGRGNVDDLTTNRSELWRIALDYFDTLPLYKKLIGGSVVTMIISEEFFLKAVGAIHQTYIQGMFNFGIIGALIVFGTRILQTAADIGCCLQCREKEHPLDVTRCIVMSSYCFLMYALTMDLFMDWRALFLYFL